MWHRISRVARWLRPMAVRVTLPSSAAHAGMVVGDYDLDGFECVLSSTLLQNLQSLLHQLTERRFLRAVDGGVGGVWCPEETESGTQHEKNKY